MFQRICSWSLTSLCAYIVGTGCGIQKENTPSFWPHSCHCFLQHVVTTRSLPETLWSSPEKTIRPDFKLMISLKLEFDPGSSPMVRHNWISLEPVCMLWPGKQIKQISTIHVWSCELHGPFQGCKQWVSNHVDPWNNIARNTKPWEATRVDYFSFVFTHDSAPAKNRRQTSTQVRGARNPVRSVNVIPEGWGVGAARDPSRRGCEGDGCVVGLGKRLSELGRENAKNIGAPKARNGAHTIFFFIVFFPPWSALRRTSTKGGTIRLASLGLLVCVVTRRFAGPLWFPSGDALLFSRCGPTHWLCKEVECCVRSLLRGDD